MNKKLYNLLKFSILSVEKTVKILFSIMYNFAAKFAKILETCKKFSTNLVNDFGNVPRRGVVPKFSDLEVIALSMTAESESIDSENRLFELVKSCKSDFPNLISRRQYNDRRKITSGLCEQIRKRIANEIDGGEDYFCVDSKPIPVCRTSRGKRCKMGKDDFLTAPDFGFCASQNTYYFGYKLHELCGLSGVVHSYDLSKASVHDIRYLNDIKPVYSNCSIFGTRPISAQISSLTYLKPPTYVLNAPTV